MMQRKMVYDNKQGKDAPEQLYDLILPHFELNTRIMDFFKNYFQLPSRFLNFLYASA